MKYDLRLCKAVDPETCRYHGLAENKHMQIAKTKMSLAEATYKINKMNNNAYLCYVEMRQAQLNYYSTNEGLRKLEQMLQGSFLENKENYQTIYRNAMNLRLKDNSPMLLPPTFGSSFSELPASNGQLNNISEFTKKNVVYLVEFNPPTEEIVLTTNIKNETEIIGLARTELEAIIKTTQWYNTSH